jgi:hypothetical protein
MPLSEYALIALAELKRYLPLTGSEKDQLLEEVINETTDDWEAEWGRLIVTRGTVPIPSVEYHTMEAGGSDLCVSELRPRNWPIIEIVSIHEDTAWPRTYGAGSLLTLDVDYQIVRGQRDYIRRIGTGGGLRHWATGTRAIKVVGRFGYADTASVPARIKARAKELAALKFRELDRQAQGVSSQGDAVGNFTRFGAARITTEMRAASQAEYRLERYETAEAA